MHNLGSYDAASTLFKTHSNERIIEKIEQEIEENLFFFLKRRFPYNNHPIKNERENPAIPWWSPKTLFEYVMSVTSRHLSARQPLLFSVAMGRFNSFFFSCLNLNHWENPIVHFFRHFLFFFVHSSQMKSTCDSTSFSIVMRLRRE